MEEIPVIIDMADRGYHDIVITLIELNANTSVSDIAKGSLVKVAYSNKDPVLMKIIMKDNLVNKTHLHELKINDAI